MKHRIIICLALVAALCMTGCFNQNRVVTEQQTVDQPAATVQEVSQSDQEKENLPTIVILATGGTIAGKGDAGKSTNYKPGQLDVESLVESVDGLGALANIRGVQICNINSDDITDAHWLQLANTINQMAQDPDIDGFVITHGTDTMDETAYFLNLTVKTDKPVVLTGSMRPSTALSADGPMNLYQAVALAGSKEAVGKGTLVLFSDGIYGGRDVQKVNTHKTDAFNEKDLGSMGYMVDSKPYFLNQSTKSHTTQTMFDVSNLSELPRVEVAYFHVDASADILDFYAKSGAEGIVIAGAGAGEYSEAWNQAVQSLANTGIPVIRCSRVGNGFISENDAFGGNVTIGGDLAPQKAAILLRLALTQTKDLQEIAAIFAEY